MHDILAGGEGAGDVGGVPAVRRRGRRVQQVVGSVRVGGDGAGVVIDFTGVQVVYLDGIIAGEGLGAVMGEPEFGLDAARHAML